MKYLSVCSGIEAATVAWHDLGWTPVGFSEIEAFPSAVLAHHYPDVPNFGDMTQYQNWNLNESDVSLLVGGTPCQSFSVAGLRKGLHDPRGGLMLTFLEIARDYRPQWVVWENVPGVLSSAGGRDFGSFLGALGELGYGWAYRVLDAQWFGLAQRRRRVFVVGCLGDQTAAAKVLFESESVCRNPAPSREKGKGFAAVAGTLAANGVERTGESRGQDPVVAVTARMTAFGEYVDDGTASTLKQRDYKDATDLVAQPMITDMRGHGDGSLSPTLRAKETANDFTPITISRMQVRRLTPTECERLQGFPDDYTKIPWRGKESEGCPDGPRYKALGNSMAVPVMRWIGERIRKQDQIDLFN